MDNKKLKKVYDDAELDWHSGYNESQAIVSMLDEWHNLSTLEIGCGEGNLASLLAYAGANVTATDYSDKQIKRAINNYNTKRIKFKTTDYHKIKDVYSVVILQGVLEHLNSPQKELQYISDKLLAPIPGAKIIISLPHWWNPRGFILETLRILLEAKTSLTDLHYFLPGDVKQITADCGLQITGYKITDESWGSGKECILDLQKRLPACLPDVPLKNIESFLKWTDRALNDGTVDYRNSGLGATAIYMLERI